MRLLLIRHGDPEYETDSLTPDGREEAALLAERMKRENADDYYVSPLGRARRTAAPTLAALGQDAQILDWLQEFPDMLDINKDPFLQEAFPDTPREENGRYRRRVFWDQLPSAWKNDERYYAMDRMFETPAAKGGEMEKIYRRICAELDAFLEIYGYERDGCLYRTKRGTNRTAALFCHFGVSCAILSHLWNVTPFVLWSSLVMAPSSVTEVYTEEREKGVVSFRATKIGDTAHLYTAGRKPSFAARFCSVYENEEERH